MTRDMQITQRASDEAMFGQKEIFGKEDKLTTMFKFMMGASSYVVKDQKIFFVDK